MAAFTISESLVESSQVNAGPNRYQRRHPAKKHNKRGYTKPKHK